MPVQGTVGQQVSTVVYHRLGLRKSTIGFGSKDVDSATASNAMSVLMTGTPSPDSWSRALPRNAST